MKDRLTWTIPCMQVATVSKETVGHGANTHTHKHTPCLVPCRTFLKSNGKIHTVVSYIPIANRLQAAIGDGKNYNDTRD